MADEYIHLNINNVNINMPAYPWVQALHDLPARPAGNYHGQRAKDLFVSMLTANQRFMFERTGCIDVLGSCGTHYRITTQFGFSFNVKDLDRNLRHCFHLADQAPMFDHFIAQAVILTTDEPQARSYPTQQNEYVVHMYLGNNQMSPEILWMAP